jgi:hypothetical protein
MSADTTPLAQRLTWSEGKYSVMTATLGKIRLFTRSWTTVRGDEKPWKLRTRLPGYTRMEWGFASIEECEHGAERILIAFLKAIGAEFSALADSIEEGSGDE